MEEQSKNCPLADEITEVAGLLAYLPPNQFRCVAVQVRQAIVFLSDTWQLDVDIEGVLHSKIETCRQVNGSGIIGIIGSGTAVGAILGKLRGQFHLRWMVGMTDQFVNETRKIDRKLQGRILEAINDLTINPIESKGDTIKPLVKDLKGLWRYRIGDYRLIYIPDMEEHRIILLAFRPRDDVYDL